MEPPVQYKIGLYKHGDLMQQVTVNAPSTVFYFDIPSVNNEEYYVRFESLYDEKYDTAEVFFTANETFKAISLNVRPQRKSEVEISSGNYFAFPFFFLIAYLFFNHQKVFAFMETAFARLSNISLSQHSAPASDDYADSARKRQKQKKTQ
ncbi:unnamed protein product [Gongylonema pulchrum]|uniref:Translocon-associated protein subunit alpha n=1 Tax=Gongylonema pulchrum TaxID=637853 RepID=A0A183E6J7_9BILA|nr:unnamed protein product [Gongylonema pulchrum]